MKITKYLLAAFVLFSAFACTDEDKFRNEVHFRLEKGGFVRFAEFGTSPLIGAETADSWEYNALVEDVNGNLSSYDVHVITPTDTVLIVSHQNPQGQFEIGITSTDVAAALEISPADFEFGQSIDFWGVATREDGVVFDAKPLTVDFTTGEVSGNTREQLTTTPGYRNALAFRLTIACPSPPDPSTYVGTMNIIQSGWLVNGPVNVVAGPGDGQITLQNVQGRGGIAGSSADFIINLNEDQTATFDPNPGWVHATFGPLRFLDAGGGFTFQCANNRIILRLRPNVAAGNFGVNTMILEK